MPDPDAQRNLEALAIQAAGGSVAESERGAGVADTTHRDDVRDDVRAFIADGTATWSQNMPYCCGGLGS